MMSNFNFNNSSPTSLAKSVSAEISNLKSESEEEQISGLAEKLDELWRM